MPTHPRRNRQLNSLLSRLLARRTVVAEDMVHLLERLAGRLRHKEIYPEEGKKAEHGEENVGAEAGVLDQRRCDEADDEVEEPVAGG